MDLNFLTTNPALDQFQKSQKIARDEEAQDEKRRRAFVDQVVGREHEDVREPEDVHGAEPEGERREPRSLPYGRLD